MADGGTTPATLDLGPQALIVARLAEEVGDEQLEAPTPCPEYAVRHLLGIWPARPWPSGTPGARTSAPRRTPTPPPGRRT